MTEILNVKNLKVRTEEKQILKGVNLKINNGEIHVIMGPNGAGKSTLANAIFNNPLYLKTGGKITFLNEDITNKRTSDIAKLGVFMSFQSPEEIQGISTFNFIKTAKNKITGKVELTKALKENVEANAKKLKMNTELITRDLNVGFSGGEKKKNEILQLLTLNPTLAILDETDSGLDVDATRAVSKGIKLFKNESNAVLIITHSTKILESLNVDYVHILVDGKIVYTAGGELAKQIEENGYTNFKGDNINE